jgi:ribonuclease P protein component
MSLKLARAVRIRRRPEFTAVQEHGRRMAARYLTILAAPAPAGVDRLGIIASRRVGGAVVRNRIKRRLREIFRQQRPDEAAAAGRPAFDLVVIARRECAAAPFADLRTEFERALGRLRQGKR